MSTALKDALERVEVAEPMQAGPLQVFGLRWHPPGELAYTTLDEALAGGQFQVTEISESGSVPTLRVVNKGLERVLMIAGEQLIGAKQNRVLNATIMVGPEAVLDVPVSCVEAGRWGYRSRSFHSKGSSSHSHLRAMMSKQVSASYRTTGKPSSDQQQVWREVDRKLRAMGSSSGSSELEKVYDDHQASLREALVGVKVSEDWSGVAFAFGGRLAGLDLFDKPGTLTRLVPKLVRAYAIDAVEAPRTDRSVGRAEVESWLQSLVKASYERFDSPGLGDDFRIQANTAVGAGLIVDDHPVHVELFPEPAGAEQ